MGVQDLVMDILFKNGDALEMPDGPITKIHPLWMIMPLIRQDCKETGTNDLPVDFKCKVGHAPGRSLNVHRAETET